MGSNECTDGLAPNEKRWDEDVVIAAIKGSGGIFSEIARRLNCDYRTAKRYSIGERATDNTEAAYYAEREAILDIAESVIISIMSKGNEAEKAKMARWVLGTQMAEERKFTQKSEINADLNVTGIEVIFKPAGEKENES